jgi:hypothetical protein
VGIRDAFIRRLGQKHLISQELLPGLLSQFVGAAPDVKQALRRRLMRGLVSLSVRLRLLPDRGTSSQPQ